MKKILFLLLTLISIWATAQKYPLKKEAPYQQGEKLTYLMYYGWIKGGEAVLSLSSDQFNGKTMSYAKAEAKSVRTLGALYHLVNIYESWFDPQTLLPGRATAYKEEGPKYRYKDNVIYFNDQNFVISERKGKVEVEPNAMDIMSAFYYIRKIDLTQIKKGDRIDIPTFFLDEPYVLKVIYGGTETVKIGLGKFKCHKLMPITSGSAFEADDSMTMYITADDNNVPVRVKLDLWIGSIKVDLINYEGLKHELIPQ